MRKPKVELRAPRKVWRITPEAPQGEFVEFVESEGDKAHPVSRPPGAAIPGHPPWPSILVLIVDDGGRGDVDRAGLRSRRV